MQLVSETSANPRINGKAATMSRLYSITPPGFLVGGATDPMKGEANVLTLLTRNKRFATDAWACKNQRLHVLSGHDESAKTLPRSMSSLGRRCIRFGNRSGEDELIDLASQIRAIVGCS